MFKPLGKVYFLVSLLVYTSIYVFRRVNIQLPELLNSYLTDFLCMPVILTLCLVGVRWIKKIPKFHLTAAMIFTMTAFYALFFEWYLPYQNTNYTADLGDVIMYFTGALVYWLIWRFEKKRLRLNLMF